MRYLALGIDAFTPPYKEGVDTASLKQGLFICLTVSSKSHYFWSFYWKASGSYNYYSLFVVHHGSNCDYNQTMNKSDKLHEMIKGARSYDNIASDYRNLIYIFIEHLLSRRISMYPKKIAIRCSNKAKNKSP